MTCIDCGAPTSNRRCKTCQRAFERDGDERWDGEDLAETEAEQRCQVRLDGGGGDE